MLKLTVSQDGSGDFASISEAVLAGADGVGGAACPHRPCWTAAPEIKNKGIRI